MINHANKALRRLVPRLTVLAADVAGNVLPIAAIAMIVMAGLIGGGIDMGRAYLVHSRLQAACDSAVLAGRRAQTNSGFDANSSAQANAYFAANFDNAAMGARSSSFTATATESGNTINATAAARIDTTVTRIFGFREFALAANCSATMGVGNSDVTMVLDTTGSMDWTLSGTTQTRIQALRAAMKSFYTTLQTATSGTNARIRYAFVPYSSSVNVGRLLYNLDPSYLADSVTIQSREARYRQQTSQTFDRWGAPVSSNGTGSSQTSYGQDTTLASGSYKRDWQCDNALPGDTVWTNNGTSYTTGPTTSVNDSGQQIVTTTLNQPQVSIRYFCVKSRGDYYVYSQEQYRTLYTYSYQTSDPVYITSTQNVFDYWDYKPVTYDASVFKTFAAVSTNTGINGAASSSTWGGCIEERSSIAAASFSYSSIAGITPAAADLDIESAPGSSSSSKWAPMWPQVSWYRTDSNGDASYSGPTRYGRSMGVYCPREARLLGTMTQTEFNAYADSLTATGATYHDIGMVWGARLSSPDGIFSANVNEPPSNGGNVARHIIFMTDGQMDTDAYIHSAWGLEYYDRRVTSDGTTSADARHTSRFLALCEAAKGKGIRIWVIAFGTGMSTDLQTCASPSSAYTAADAAQLNGAFQDIARQVGELRVVQ